MGSDLIAKLLRAFGLTEKDFDKLLSLVMYCQVTIVKKILIIYLLKQGEFTMTTKVKRGEG